MYMESEESRGRRGASWELPQQATLAAAFWISWRLFREYVGQPNNKELQ